MRLRGLTCPPGAKRWGPGPCTETLLPASGLRRLSCPIPPRAVHAAEVCARVCPVPPSPAVWPRSCLCPLPSLCVCLCVSPSSPLPFPVGLTPDVLGVPGKGAFPSASPSQPSAHPPRGCVLFQGNKQREVSSPGIRKGVRIPKSPKSVGAGGGLAQQCEVNSHGQLWPAVGGRVLALVARPGLGPRRHQLTADQSAATGHTKRPDESVRWTMSKE